MVGNQILLPFLLNLDHRDYSEFLLLNHQWFQGVQELRFFSYILNDYSVHIILYEVLSLDKKIKNLDETFEYAPNEQGFQHFLLVSHLLEYYNEDKLYEPVSDRSQVAMQELKDKAQLTYSSV